MKNIWYYLREFESTDLIISHIKNKYNYQLPKNKANEIASAFTQGREFFKSCQRSDLSVMPILQYYGIIALSRGLILILNKDARENNIKPSHGLSLNNWDRNFQNVSVKISNGTFLELIRATKNVSYFRAGSSGVNWSVSSPEPIVGESFSLKKLAFSFPDLEDQIKAWLDEDVPVVKFDTLKTSEDTIDIKIDRNIDHEVIMQICPPDVFTKAEFTRIDKEFHLLLSKDNHPNFTQKWVSAFQVIGDVCLSPPLSKQLRLNLIASMYAASFILSTISRYHPSVWQDVSKGVKNDRILPLVISMLDLISERYPQIMVDILKAPYDFNK